MKQTSLIKLSSGLITLDLVITLLFWNYESNPVVLAIGINGFILTHIIGIIGIPLLYYYFEGLRNTKTFTLCIYLLIVEYGLVFLTNLYVIIP